MELVKLKPKIRKAVKWAGVILTVLLLGLWIGSAWWNAWWRTKDGWMVRVGNGRLVFSINNDTVFRDEEYGKHIEPAQQNLYWWPDWVHETSDIWKNPIIKWYIYIPLWMVMLPALGVTILAWRLDTQAKQWTLVGRCGRCGYDRSGLSSDAACPECGKMIENKK